MRTAGELDAHAFRWRCVSVALIAILSSACRSRPDTSATRAPTPNAAGTAVEPRAIPTGPGEVVSQFGGLDHDSAMAFDPSGELLATTSASGITLWDLRTGFEMRFIAYRSQLYGSPFPPRVFGGDRVVPAFSPDGRFVARVPVFEPVNAASPRDPPDAWAVSSGEPVGQPEWTIGERGIENPSFPWAPNELQAWRTLRTSQAVARAAAYTGEGRFFMSDGERVVAIRHGPWPQGMSTLQLIRTRDGVELLRRETQGIFHFGASADGRWLATTDGRGELHVLALPSGQERALQVPGNGGSPASRPAVTSVGALAFSADGSRLALSLESSVSIVDTARMKQVLGIPTARAVRRLLFSPDGRQLAGLVGDGYGYGVRLWDAATGRESERLEDRTCPIALLSISPDQQDLAVATCEPTGEPPYIYDRSVIRLWSLGGRGGPRAIVRQETAIRSITFTPDGRSLLVASQQSASSARSSGLDGEVAVWNLSTAERALALAEPDWESSSPAAGVTPDGREHVAIVFVMQPREPDDSGINAFTEVSYEAVLRRWDASTGKEHGGVPLGVGEEGLEFRLSLDTRRVAQTGADAIHILDSRTGKALRKLPRPEGADSFAARAWFPDGRRLAVSVGERFSERSTVEIWDAVTSERAHRLPGEIEALRSIAVSADGSLVAAGGCDGRVSVWSKPTWDRLFDVAAHEGCVAALAFRGRDLVSGGADGFIRFWDSSGRWTALLASSADGEDWIVVAPDGRYDGTATGAGRLVAFRDGDSAWPAEGHPAAVPTPGLFPALILPR